MGNKVEWADGIFRGVGGVGWTEKKSLARHRCRIGTARSRSTSERFGGGILIMPDRSEVNFLGARWDLGRAVREV